MRRGSVSDQGAEAEHSEGGEQGATSPDSAPRSSGRKRKRRVFNTPSDEEVIDNLVDEPGEPHYIHY